jgi:hypothetical protein
LGWPLPTTSDAASEPARLREVERPPTRNSSPAVAARPSTSSSQPERTGTAREQGSPRLTRTPLVPSVTSLGVTQATHRPSKPAPRTQGQQRPGGPEPPRRGLHQGGGSQPIEFPGRVRQRDLTASHWLWPGLPGRPPSQERPDPAELGPVGRPRPGGVLTVPYEPLHIGAACCLPVANYHRRSLAIELVFSLLMLRPDLRWHQARGLSHCHPERSFTPVAL